VGHFCPPGSGSGIRNPGFFSFLPFCRAKPKKNTETFQPSHEPTEMRLIAVPSGLARYDREILTRDVIMVPELFCKPADLAIYDKVRKRQGHEHF
jgi:hypothetical protein